MKLKTKSWLDNNFDTKLEVTLSKAWMIHDWRDGQKSGAGLCLYSTVLLPTGDIVAVETVISKKNLAKVLLMVLKEEEEDAVE